MEYKIQIFGLNAHESHQDERSDDLDIYTNALIEDLRSVHDVSSVRIDGCNVTIDLEKDAKHDRIHAEIKGVLKNYFEHLGPFGYDATR